MKLGDLYIEQFFGEQNSWIMLFSTYEQHTACIMGGFIDPWQSYIDSSGLEDYVI